MLLVQGVSYGWESVRARYRTIVLLWALWGGGLGADSVYPLVCADVQAGGDSVEFLAVEEVRDSDVVSLGGLVFE